MGLLTGFLGVFLPLLLVLGIVGSMHYYTVYTTERSTREASETLNVDLARRMIESDIGDVVADLMFLAEHIERRGLPGALPWEREQRIAEQFKVFAKNKRLYDQIRYLDYNGREIVRVNYANGEPRVVPEGRLQNKASRYYFREALAQERGGIYLSRFDLNVEEGKIEQPHKPVLRFGTPVFGNNGSKRGIVLLNYFGERLISNFKRAAANIAGHVELVNQDGYWLSSPDKADEWGFMFGNKVRFSTRLPKAWSEISTKESGQFETAQGLFTFATVAPTKVTRNAVRLAPVEAGSAANTGEKWKIISRVSARELSATLPLFLQNHLALYVGMFGLILLGSWVLATSQIRHRQAEAQRDYEQRFRQTMENIDLAAIALNRSGEVTFCNDYFLGMTGWHRNDVVGQDWIAKFVPHDLEKEVRDIIKRMGTPQRFPTHFELEVKTRDGNTKLIAWNNTLSYDAEGTPIGVTGIGEDITEKRRSEIELRKLYRAVEQSPSIVLITDPKGQIEYVNPKFTEVSGYSLEEVIGKNPRFLKSGETSREEYNHLWDTVLNGGEWRGEFHNRRKSGELYWESASISGIRNAEGEITHFIAVKEDITERKRLESEVDERNRELARSETLAAMGRMASMIAHDLRNPLSSVKMTLQILGKHPGMESDRQANELRLLSLEQIRYMEEILSDMLTYSRPDALKPDWITIDKVIDMAVSISQRKLDEFNARLVTNYHPGLPTIYGDATKLRQVFSNLITNAAQATEDIANPKIEIDVMVELGSSGTGIRIEVCDNGSGIVQEDHEKLFEPFFTTHAKGTGLGLAIVKRILDQHQASVSLEPNRPRGTCAVVTLPVAPPEKALDTQDRERAAS
jgi:PAS domain S-box-containing protein